MSFNVLRYHYLINDIVVDKSDRLLLTKYFNNYLAQLADEHFSNVQFVSDVFHYVTGYLILAQSIDEEYITSILKFVYKCWNGLGFCPTPIDSPLANLMKTKKMQQDIYSTYYCLVLILICGKDIEEKYKKGILEAFTTYFQPSGWIYNSTWSETKEEKRFDIELCLQALTAMRIGKILGLNLIKLPYHTERLALLINYLKNPRYITVLYYVLLTLIELESLDKCDSNIFDSLNEFVLKHYSTDEKGFKEYLFENVKTFKYRGVDGSIATASHRFSSDFNQASINATTYSIWIGKNIPPNSLLEFLISNKKELMEFYKSLTTEVNAGYGTAIKIARYSSFFGPLSTPLESINVMIGKSLLPEL